ncbi:MAG TPA: response regulator [Bryobacteraceae bacterium]|nr:response regulator [Bryobacteraceae bacterium]
MLLVADDENTVRAYLAVKAENGQDALERMEEKAGRIDRLITDIRMPCLDGIAWAHAVVQKFEKTPISFISGYPFDLEEQRIQHPGLACAFVTKPFGRPELLDAIRKCLKTPRAAGTA